MKKRVSALKRQEMHAMENASLTNALREDVPRKKKGSRRRRRKNESSKIASPSRD